VECGGHAAAVGYEENSRAFRPYKQMEDITMTDFSHLVIAPAPEQINPLSHAARVSTMVAALGAPRLPLDDRDCHDDHASNRVRELLETRNVGPFRATGITPFLDLLTRVFARVREQNPELFHAVGSAGILCVRFVRGSSTNFSNHSWGTALDVTFLNPSTGKQELDPRGNGLVQVGCIELNRFFEADGEASGERCFWGAGFPREDGMHFEASDELIRMWKGQGKI
jgi:D-alanyl-D-alanine carboxypeptidase